MRRRERERGQGVDAVDAVHEGHTAPSLTCFCRHAGPLENGVSHQSTMAAVHCQFCGYGCFKGVTRHCLRGLQRLLPHVEDAGQKLGQPAIKREMKWQEGGQKW